MPTCRASAPWVPDMAQSARNPLPVSGRSLLRRQDGLGTTVLAALDGLAVIGIAWALVVVQFGLLTTEYVVLVLVLLGALAALFDRAGIYRTNRSFTREALVLIRAWILAFLGLAFLGFATKQGATYSRLYVGYLFVLGLGAQLLLHMMFYLLQKHWFSGRTDSVANAIVIGQGDLANFLASKVNNNPWLNQRLIGKVTLTDEDDNGTLDFGASSLAQLGSVPALRQILAEHDVSVVYIVTPLDASRVLGDVYFTLLDSHVAVHWIPDIFSLRLVNHSLNEIAGMPVLTLSETPLKGTSQFAKAVEDRVLSAALLVMLAPLMALIACAIKLGSKGPVFFRQERTGWSGRKFAIWKFRSMVVHEPEEGVVQQASRHDPRVTRVGAILRRTSLDELPQLFNVLRGEMSLVGPRPHALQHDAEYSQRILDYFARHHIKPGITGLAQVRGHRGETRDINQMIQRVESDIEYINNWSLWLDFIILLRTTLAFTGKYAY